MLSLAPFVLGVLALIMAFLPGLVLKNNVFGQEVKSTISLFSLIFGGGTRVTSAAGESSSSSFNGGLSFFGLVSFILLVLALLIYVLKPFMKSNKKSARKSSLLIAGLFILAGVFVFLVKVAGTDFVIDLGLLGKLNTPFVDVLKEYSLGIGSILYGVFALLAGLITFAKK